MWLIEQWRDGEKIREVRLPNVMIQQRLDETFVITFPPHELVGGFVIAVGDELNLSKIDDSES